MGTGRHAKAKRQEGRGGNLVIRKEEIQGAGSWAARERGDFQEEELSLVSHTAVQ